jgi:hypothetical protein
MLAFIGKGVSPDLAAHEAIMKFESQMLLLDGLSPEKGSMYINAYAILEHDVCMHYYIISISK